MRRYSASFSGKAFALAFCSVGRHSAGVPDLDEADIRTASRDRYEKAKAAAIKNNLNYAVTLLVGLMKMEPGFFDGRMLLRASQIKRDKTRGKFTRGLSKFFPKLFSAIGMKSALKKGKYDMVLVKAEEILCRDSEDVFAHEMLSEACMKMDFPRAAVSSLDIIRKTNPKNTKMCLKMVSALEKSGQFDQALAIMGEQIKANPNDHNLPRLQKDLAARATISRGNYEKLATGEGSVRDVLRDKDAQESQERDESAHKSTEALQAMISEKEEKLQEVPEDYKLCTDIAALYVQMGDYDRALEYYDYVQNNSMGADAYVDRAIADTVLRKYDEQLDMLDPGAPDFEEQAEAIRGEKLEFQMDDCRRRVDKYPTDMDIRFELGKLCFENGEFEEALHALQRAQNSPSHRLKALNMLGQCFAMQHKHDLAIRSFENGIKEKQIFDEERKEMVYHLGCVLEAAGRGEEAVEHFKSIYELDIGYRDIAQRVDHYYSGN